MRVIVTGASGFVGCELLPFLAAKGHTGVASGRIAPNRLPDGWIGISRNEILKDTVPAEAFDALIHLEVKQHVSSPSVEDIAEFERVNVGGTREWLDWCVRHRVSRFVFASSIKAVGVSPGAQSERDVRPPDTPYGVSKAKAESLVKAWSLNAPSRVATILRSCPVYGPGNDANLAAFVRQVLREQPCYVGDGSVKKSLVGRRNFAAAIEFVLRRGEPGCEVYNVSDAETVTVRELAGIIAALAGAKPPRSIPKVAAVFAACIGDALQKFTGGQMPLTTSRLRTLCEESVFPSEKLVTAGFRHVDTLECGLAEMVNWALNPDDLRK